MKILDLVVKNVKRIRAVEIRPDGNVVIVGGRNGQGKSSVLDSIAYALGGKDLICKEPVRRGEKHAEVTCDLGELIVRRTFTAEGGGTLTVETKDGARFTSPQGRLNDLTGSLSFDPLEFARMAPAGQAATLRALVGLDFAELDRERDAAFNARTDVNREGRALKARLDGIPAQHEAPELEVSAHELLDEIERAQETNLSHKDAREKTEQLVQRVHDTEDAIATCREQIATLTASLAEYEKRAEVQRLNVAEWKAGVDKLVDVDLAPLRERLAGLEATNRKVRENRSRATAERELEAKRAESAKLTERIDGILAAKQKAIAEAQFPVEGLAFDVNGGVTLNGLPFDQASAAEQLRVSVAIGAALNPSLRVMLVRDASLLDSEALELMGQLADQYDTQLWLERVEAEGATVVIEDGTVAAAAAQGVRS
jgi:DNA repair exonuclease SbcCD ATPase subunit